MNWALIFLWVYLAHQESSMNFDIRVKADPTWQCVRDIPANKQQGVIDHKSFAHHKMQDSDAFQHLSFPGKVDLFPPDPSQPAAYMLF